MLRQLFTTSAANTWCVLAPGLMVKSDLEVWRGAGETHVSVNTMGMGLDSLDAQLDFLATMAKGLRLA